MVGPSTPELAIAVSEAGGLGSFRSPMHLGAGAPSRGQRVGAGDRRWRHRRRARHCRRIRLGHQCRQVGTAYLFCPEANVPPLNRQALVTARDDDTALTNLFTGRPARSVINRLMRELGPISEDAPAFPLAGGALLPLKAAAEARGLSDFTSLGLGRLRPWRERCPPLN